MLFEIRNYHFDPDRIDAYKRWAKAEALPLLSRKMDLLGFWVKTDDAPSITGEPQDKLGPANVTWIIRWRDMAHRNDVFSKFFVSPEWLDVVSRVPGGKTSYLRTEGKFAEALL